MAYWSDMTLTKPTVIRGVLNSIVQKPKERFNKDYVRSYLFFIVHCKYLLLI